MSGLLIIARHGESEWNARGVWTGTTDVHLTDKGKHEAALMGEALADLQIDQAFISEQVRTHETLDGMLEAMKQSDVPKTITGAFNERDYGVYTGKNKWEVKAAIGEEAFQGLRRGWDFPIDDGETLKDVYERSVPYYTETVVPLLNKGKNVLVVAHGNSIRSLQKYIETISDEAIGEVEMIFGTLLIFTVGQDGRVISKDVRSIKTTLPPA